MNEPKNTKITMITKTIIGEKIDTLVLSDKDSEKLNVYTRKLMCPDPKKPKVPKKFKNVCSNCKCDKLIKVPIQGPT